MAGVVNVLPDAAAFDQGFLLLDELLGAGLDGSVQFKSFVRQGYGAFANPEQLSNRLCEFLMVGITLAFNFSFSLRSQIGKLAEEM